MPTTRERRPGFRFTRSLIPPRATRALWPKSPVQRSSTYPTARSTCAERPENPRPPPPLPSRIRRSAATLAPSASRPRRAPASAHRSAHLSRALTAQDTHTLRRRRRVAAQEKTTPRSEHQARRRDRLPEFSAPFDRLGRAECEHCLSMALRGARAHRGDVRRRLHQLPPRDRSHAPQLVHAKVVRHRRLRRGAARPQNEGCSAARQAGLGRCLGTAAQSLAQGALHDGFLAQAGYVGSERVYIPSFSFKRKRARAHTRSQSRV
eukprot:1053532-Pleurochrysis_carterae.AAC.9